MKIVKFSALNGINSGDIMISDCIEAFFAERGVKMDSFDLLLRSKIQNKTIEKESKFLHLKKTILNVLKKSPYCYYIVHVVYYNFFKWYKIKKIINGYAVDDPIIIGGGNLLFNKNGSPFLFAVTKIVNGFKKKRRIILTSVGVGPFSLTWKKKISDIISGSNYVSVRDYGSVKLISELKSNFDPDIIPDPVFLFRDLFSDHFNYLPKTQKCFGINIMKIGDSRQDVKKMAKNVRILSERMNMVPIIINTDFSSDRYFANEFSCIMLRQEGVNVQTYNIFQKEDVFHIYNLIDFIICFRMHSAIFAASFEIPFFIYSWDHKVPNMVETVFGKEFLDVLLLSSPDFPVDEIDRNISIFPQKKYCEKIKHTKQIILDKLNFVCDNLR